MEIINELEHQSRGVYAGGVGYFGGSKEMDLCIALRTAIIKNKNIYIQAGAGIVFDSVPQNEYLECNPDKAGVSLDITVEAADKKIPTLGVCLGHQSIGQAFGGKIKLANQIVHGKTDSIIHNHKGIFRDLPSPFVATRYHSLSICKKTIPSSLEITAETKCGEIMAIQHKELPIYGVQFHPESIMSEHGHLLLKNFVSIVDGTYERK